MTSSAILSSPMGNLRDGNETVFFLSKIRELEEEKLGLQMSIEASSQREKSLHRVVDSFKQMLEEGREEKKRLLSTITAQQETVQTLQEKVEAVIAENASLRGRLQTLQNLSDAKRPTQPLQLQAPQKSPLRSGSPAQNRRSHSDSELVGLKPPIVDRQGRSGAKVGKGIGRSSGSNLEEDDDSDQVTKAYLQDRVEELTVALEERRKELLEAYSVIATFSSHTKFLGLQESSGQSQFRSARAPPVNWHQQQTPMSLGYSNSGHSEQGHGPTGGNVLARRNAELELTVAELSAQLDRILRGGPGLSSSSSLSGNAYRFS